MATNLVIINENGKPVTNSLLVAEKFEKEHKHVLDSIRALLTTAENSAVLSMFVETTYLNSQNKEQPMFLMNRDGFSLLVMGFTGQKALNFKIEFIDAFNKMEQSTKQIDFSNPDTVLMLAQNWKDEQIKRIAAEKKAAALQPKADFVDRTMDLGHLVDIGQAAKLLKLPFGRNTFFKKLKERGIFFKNRNEPKQEYIDRGYFELRDKEVPRDNHPSFMITKVLVARKGLFWLSREFGGTQSNFPTLNPQ